MNSPGISGIECIRQVKDKTPSTQFMMFTVYENDEKAKRKEAPFVPVFLEELWDLLFSVFYTQSF